MGWTSSLTYIRRKSGFKWRCDVPLLCSTAQHSTGLSGVMMCRCCVAQHSTAEVSGVNKFLKGC
ncbi:hypothetical protein E2C01_083866 [Portunus trituberculatus]|uniref:Uncharacterized protein n=1 Tax=Portunus trituberculatus TaxID=210409 RepID=A0A5B7ITM4_PORTR|nr:hypothetical protein [Portunus trituberculatus]